MDLPLGLGILLIRGRTACVPAARPREAGSALAKRGKFLQSWADPGSAGTGRRLRGAPSQGLSVYDEDYRGTTWGDDTASKPGAEIIPSRISGFGPPKNGLA